jgi:ABC-type antimicrobial peptide transport system permease subunit
VTSSSSPVTAIYQFNGGVEWPGKREDQRKGFATVAVNYDYTKTLGMRILQGRDFSPEFNDTTSIILNQASVSYMGLTNPIGEQIRFWGKTFSVIGVVEDVVMISPTSSVDPAIFIFDPTWASDVSIRLASQIGPSALLPEIEKIFARYNPSYPFVYRFTNQEFAMKFKNIERIGNLSNLFSILAVLISCLGLFGLSAFTAEQRTKEIGIRKVLGATLGNVVVLISRDFTILVTVAFLLAAPLGAWFMNEWLSKYEYRIDIEWWFIVFAGATALLLALSVVSFQALKAALANPANSLRNE